MVFMGFIELGPNGEDQNGLLVPESSFRAVVLCITKSFSGVFF